MQPFSSRIARRIASHLLLMVAGAGLVDAQTTSNPNRVTFFTEPNFRGEALTVEAGASLETLDSVKRSDQRPWTFGISSVRVEGTARATVHAAPGFRGDSLEITASITDLYAMPRGREAAATWDRSIASLSVTGPRVAMPASPPPPYSQPPPGYSQPPPGYSQPPPTVVVVVPSPPPPPPPIRPARPLYNTRTAEAAIQRAYRDVLDRAADPAGLRHYRERLLRQGWNERQLITDLQRSSEARAINADEAIGRAYREVLKREPDPGGLNHYRSKWRDGWTQGQIREDLRRSNEGRDNASRAAITRAYRELLGREPDPEGFAVYERLMREQGYTDRQVREAIMDGDEYRKRRGKK